MHLSAGATRCALAPYGLLLAIQPLSLNILLHGPRRAVAEALAGGGAAAEIGARKLDQRHLNLGGSNIIQPLCGNNLRQHTEVGLGRAAAANHSRSRQFADARWLAPGWQVTQRIGAHEQKDGGLRLLLPDGSECFHGIADTAALDLQRRS